MRRVAGEKCITLGHGYNAPARLWRVRAAISSPIGGVTPKKRVRHWRREKTKHPTKYGLGNPPIIE